MKRREKKSESLDIRLPYEQKKAFMDATQKRGETASEAIRDFIASYVEETRLAYAHHPIQEITMTLSRHRIKTMATAAGAAMGVFALTALPSAADDTAFETLDQNGDGVLSEGEIAPGEDGIIIEMLDKDGSGDVSPEEFEPTVRHVIVTKTNADGEEDPDGEFVRKEVKVFKFSADDSSDGKTKKKIMIERTLDEATVSGDISEEDVDIIIEKILEEEGLSDEE